MHAPPAVARQQEAPPVANEHAAIGADKKGNPAAPAKAAPPAHPREVKLRNMALQQQQSATFLALVEVGLLEALRFFKSSLSSSLLLVSFSKRAKACDAV